MIYSRCATKEFGRRQVIHLSLTIVKSVHLGLTGCKMSLTESFMMQPSASVCALCFAHPDAKYFSVGQVNMDQVAEYSSRRGEDGVEATERWLGSTVLGYENR